MFVFFLFTIIIIVITTRFLTVHAMISVFISFVDVLLLL